MNDKIKLFNEQAIKYAQESLNDIAIVNKSGIMYNYNDLYTEKFAELIVKECIKEITDRMLREGIDESNNPGYYKAINRVEEHFGVEE